MKNKVLKKIGLLTLLTTLSSCSLPFGEVSSSSSEVTIPNEIASLKTPELSLNYDNGVVSWSNVENAEYYNYIVNDGEVQTTTSTTLKLEDKSNVSVQAVYQDVYSKWSNAVTYYDVSDIYIDGRDKNHSVYFFDANIPNEIVRDGQTIKRPNNPTKANHTFDNWYKDPFFQTKYDFDEPIRDSVVIYANYIEDALIKDTYYWIKANEKMTSSIQSSFSSNSGWKFIPLKLNASDSIKEFSAIVTVNNASVASPCYFLVMDGFDDNPGRTYWKNGGSDFSITSNGTYRITFSVETLYIFNGNQVNVKFESLSGGTPSYANDFNVGLDTPVVEVKSSENKAIISNVENADAFEVIINNKAPEVVKNNEVTLNKGEHISVRAFNDNNYSNWSIPKANINYIYEQEEEKTHAYVYFYEANEFAKRVELNTYIDSKEITKDGYEFQGWYLDLAKTKLATFPYLVSKNTVFYPKWKSNSDVLNKEYYSLVNSSDTKVAGLTWNLDNYEFYEYQVKNVYLAFGEQYYVKSLSSSKTWGPYTVDESGTYNLYFSEDHLWNANTDQASNVYIASNLERIYFTNVKGWSDTIYAYVWNDSSNQYYKSWPGVEMTYLENNSYGQQVYVIDVDTSLYDMIVFSHGTNKVIVTQTVDISLTSTDDNGFYVTNKNSSGKYEVASYSR